VMGERRGRDGGETGEAAYVLHGGGDVQPPDARRGELPRVDVGDFPHGGVHVLQVLALHHQDGLSGVEVELQEEKTNNNNNNNRAVRWGERETGDTVSL